MRKELFRGSGVAIVTPFCEDGSIDFQKFEELINWQIHEGTDAIIVCGTTGETSAMTEQEFEATVDSCVSAVRHRVPVIAGAGSNNTHHAIERSRFAEKVGCDGLLHVTPYYNKTTQKGLVAHFTAIADSVNIPTILYNVPSRTGMSCTAQTYLELSKHPNIVGVKEASGDFGLVLSTRYLCPPDFYIYSGNDDQIVPILSLGGSGVISVLANIAPKDTHDICRLYFEGKARESSELQVEYSGLIDALFCETNPIPVKAALALMKKCGDTVRLPLVRMSEQGLARLQTEMAKMGLLG